MEIAALVLLCVFGLIGFAAIFFTTFGTLIILVGALLYAAMTEFAVLTLPALVVLMTLYLVGEVLEYVLTFLGVRKFGASRAAGIGAMLGAVVGAMLGVTVLGVGLILGMVFGLFFGAFLVEYAIKGDLRQSLKAGAGGLLGRLGAIITKVIIALLMFAVLGTRIAAH